MDGKHSTTFQLKVKVNSMCNKGLFNSQIILCICSGGNDLLTLKA